jgi:hypothetical protein
MFSMRVLVFQLGASVAQPVGDDPILNVHPLSSWSNRFETSFSSLTQKKPEFMSLNDLLYDFYVAAYGFVRN